MTMNTYVITVMLATYFLYEVLFAYKIDYDNSMNNET
eukprot:CAMPEP_0116974968 /NCGR_PEP_ID=MMETSP0467-20121206/55507_1 /TAXON_ID=283647 /ORGANISM="Mesodinium pulex, Strain SPMC105" /LENGTH=36 /DNA_ID= /DNA_START= /DNA_END= /DNA_ORIENTATION=